MKYLTRWREKGGILDLEKALHFGQLRMELAAGFPVPDSHSCRYSMGLYVRENRISIEEDPIFYALDGWVAMGFLGNEAGNHRYVAFSRLLTQYIEEQKDIANGQG